MMIDWDDLITEVQSAQRKMSRKNEHRMTLWKVERALTSVRQALSERSRVEPSTHGQSTRSL